jgi:hypothetical protein
MAGIPVVVRLGAFVENIAGTVTNPNNAIGAPNEVFTENTSGSWTAKWQLEAPETPVALSRYGVNSVKLHCRRANDTGADPSIWRIKIRDQHDNLVYDFFDGAQLTKAFGAINFNENWSTEALRAAIHECVRRGDPTPSTVQMPYINGAAFAKDSGELVLVLNNTRSNLVKIANFGSSSVYGKTVNVPAGPSATFNRGRLKVSDDGTVCVYAGNTEALISYIEVEVSPGVFEFHRITNPAGFSAGSRGFALSPSGNYCIHVDLNTSNQNGYLFRLNREDKVWENITPVELQGTSTRTGHMDVSWNGNTVSIARSAGFFAWAWDEATETLTPISGVTGGQFAAARVWVNCALSSDNRYLAVAYTQSLTSGTDRQLWVEDLQNPGVGARRTFTLPQRTQGIYNMFWLPQDAGVAFGVKFASFHSDPVWSDYRGPLYTVRVSGTDPLTLFSGPINNFPLSTKIPVAQVAISEGHIAVCTSTSNQILYYAPYGLFIWERPDTARTKEVFETKAIWDLLLKPVAFANMQDFGSVSVNRQPLFQTEATSIPDRHITPSLEVSGQYWVNVQDGTSRNLSPLAGSLDARITSITRQYPAATPTNITSAASGIFFISDCGRYYRWDHNLREIINDGGVITTAARTPAGITNTHTWGAFRRGADAEDPYRNLVIWAAIHSSYSIRFYLYNITESGDVVHLVDWTSTGFLGIPTWSYDGQYVAWVATNVITIFKFDPNEANFFINCGSITRGVSYGTQYVHWHPTDKTSFIVTAQINDHAASATFCKMDNTTITVLDSAGTTSAFSSAANGDDLIAVRWSPNGQHVMTFHKAPWNVPFTSNSPMLPAIFEWDASKLSSGLKRVPLPSGSEVFMVPAGKGKSNFGFTSRLGTLYSDSRSGLGYFAELQQREVFYTSPNPEIPWGNLTYDAGWTVEIETWGDNNAVQLEAVEVTMMLNQFALPAPTNLQVVTASGTQGLVQWEWEPE